MHLEERKLGKKINNEATTKTKWKKWKTDRIFNFVQYWEKWYFYRYLDYIPPELRVVINIMCAMHMRVYELVESFEMM